MDFGHPMPSSAAQAIGRSRVRIRRCAVNDAGWRSRGDRLDDIGGQEGERQQAAEVAIADPHDGGELGDAADLTRDERLETAMRPSDLLQQHRIGLGRAGGRRLDDQRIGVSSTAWLG